MAIQLQNGRVSLPKKSILNEEPSTSIYTKTNPQGGIYELRIKQELTNLELSWTEAINKIGGAITSLTEDTVWKRCHLTKLQIARLPKLMRAISNLTRMYDYISSTNHNGIYALSYRFDISYQD